LTILLLYAININSLLQEEKKMPNKNEILVLGIIQQLGNGWNIKDLIHIIGPTMEMEGDKLEQILTSLIRKEKLEISIRENELELIPV